MRTCETMLWCFPPSPSLLPTRPNRTAPPPCIQDLLGTDFKRRMVMDGQVHAITFICTKTDNLDVSAHVSAACVELVCSPNAIALRLFFVCLCRPRR